MKLWLLLAVFMPGAWLWADEQAYPEAPAATNVEEQAIPSVDELEGDYESPDSLPSAPQASNWEPTAVALPADMDPGDNKAVRRFVKKQLNMAEEAADKKHWETVSEKVALLEELVGDQKRMEKRLRDLQDQLTAMAAVQAQRGLRLAEDGDLVEAVKAWRKSLQLRPGYKVARNSLDKYRERIQGKAEELYRKGIDRYVEGDLDSAISSWENALVLHPGHAKVMKNLARARDKKKALKK